MYVVGGCTASACGSTDVRSYDPAADTWSQVAAYPEAVAWESCGAIGGKIYCAGGTTDAATIVHTYVYDPAANTWSPLADLPIDLWGSGYTAAEGQLLVSGGVTANNSAITNQGYAFDPTADGWTRAAELEQHALPGRQRLWLLQDRWQPGWLRSHRRSPAPRCCPASSTAASITDVSWLSETPTTLTLAAGRERDGHGDGQRQRPGHHPAGHLHGEARRRHGHAVLGRRRSRCR